MGSNLAELRKFQHLQSQRSMKDGQFSQAETILLDTISKFGCHVGLLGDLIYISYIQNRVDNFESYLQKLEEEMSKAEDMLCAESRFKTLLLLAKFHEEAGEIEKSLSACDRAIEFCEDINCKKKIKIQKLRLLGSLGPSTHLSQLYSDCCRVDGYDSHLQIELFHGLMLAEKQMLGDFAGKNRLHQGLKLATDPIDRRLLIGDYLEQEFLILGQTQLSTDMLAELQTGDAFEQILYSYTLNDFDAFSHFEDRLTKMSWLRCAAILLKLTNHADQSLLRKFILIFESLSAATQKLLKSKWHFLREAQQSYELTLKGQVLHYQDRQLDLARKGNLEATLHFFKERKESSLEEFVQLALKEVFDPYSTDQVRMILSRIKKDFSRHLGISVDMFKLTRGQVVRADQVQIKILI